MAIKFIAFTLLLTIALAGSVGGQDENSMSTASMMELSSLSEIQHENAMSTAEAIQPPNVIVPPGVNLEETHNLLIGGILQSSIPEENTNLIEFANNNHAVYVPTYYSGNLASDISEVAKASGSTGVNYRATFENGLSRDELQNQYYNTIFTYSGGTRTAITAIDKQGVTANKLVLISPIRGTQNQDDYNRAIQRILNEGLVDKIEVWQSPQDKLLQWVDFAQIRFEEGADLDITVHNVNLNSEGWAAHRELFSYVSKVYSRTPTVQAFDVSPQSLEKGESLTITYTVLDNSGSGLKQVELWRKYETSDWEEVDRNNLVGESGPLTRSFMDLPPAPGTYWYGVHVADNAGNWNDQKNSNTNYQPISFEPAEVQVTYREIGQISAAHELQRLKHNVDISSMAFSPDGTKLATIDGISGYDGIARIWDVETGVELQNMSLEDEMRSVIRSVFSKVAFSLDSTRIGTVGSTTTQIWDVETGVELQRMNCGQEVNSAAFSPDFTKVATANDDYIVRIWDVATGAELMELDPYPPETIAYYEVKPVVFSPDGSKVAVCRGGTVQIWDASTGAEIQKIKNAGERVVFSPDSSKVATSTSLPFSNKYYVRIWDVTTGAELQRLNHTYHVVPVDFQQGGNKIITASSRIALIWDVATGTELKRLDHSSPVRQVLFSPDGSKFAISNHWNDTVRIWDETTGAEIQKLPQKSDRLSNPSPTSILFSPDGTKMAVSVDDETVRIWDITT